MATIDCKLMATIANSVLLRCSLAFNLIIAICVIPVLVWATWQLWSMKTSRLFHNNFKILIQIHLFGFFLHCSGRISLHSIDLFNYTVRDNPCDMVPNIYRCFVLRLIYNTGLWITNSTALLLIIERWLATSKSATYEQEPARMGVWLAILHFVIAAIPLAVLYSKFKFEGGVMYYCVTAQASLPYVGQISVVVSLIFQFSAFLSFSYLHRHNKLIRKSNIHNSTLSNRYQLEQNISSIACLKHFANISTIFLGLFSSSYIALMYYASSLEPYQYFALLEMNVAFPSYALVSIIMLSRTLKKNREQIEVNLAHHMNTPNHFYLDYFKQQIA